MSSRRSGVLLAAGLVFLAATCAAEESLDDDIGQMLMFGFRGVEVERSGPFSRQLREIAPGGVVLFDYDVAAGSRPRNIESPEQLARLVEQLQSAAAVPLLIAVDQEGGRVARLKPRAGFTTAPSAAELGRAGSESRTRSAAAETARQLADLGINLNLAPVVDLNLNRQNPIIGRIERSFGADPEEVVRQARWVIEEHRAAGVLTTLKHFPGHGSSLDDSHLGLPDVTGRWRPEELEPYRTLIAAGLADCVMTAHLYNADLDPDYPASLSRPTTTGLLRRELGFEGVILTDDLGMGALTGRYPLEERLRLAIEAGADLLVLANNLGEFDAELPDKAFEGIRRLVAAGAVSPDRIRESADRIRAVKRRLGLIR